MVNHYNVNYADFHGELYREVRRDAFGEDIGQNSWLTATEQDMFIPWLNLGPGKLMLDAGCGAGGPALRIASMTGCSVVGVDSNSDAIRAARSMAANAGIADGAEFQTGDAGSLSFREQSFDAITCIDAINHLPDRESVLREWCRLLKPKGRMLFTDPLVLTGPVSNEEFAARTPAGFYLLTPEGHDERVLALSGLRLLRKEDLTANMAKIANSRLAARAERQEDLRSVEGSQAFESQQMFLKTVALLAGEKRMARILFLAEK